MVLVDDRRVALSTTMPELLDKRLIFVNGKGGVGRTTVATALGLLASRRGKRTILCEVAGQERMSRLLGREGVGPTETEVRPRLSAISIDPQRALEEYLRYQLRSRRLYDLLVDNRVFQYLAAAAPGVPELVTIGKVWELAQLERPWTDAQERYDLVIVDAPATGHGLGILRTPKAFRDIARVGPIRRQAERIHEFLIDAQQTGVVAVTIPEELAVNEALEFQHSLAEEMSIDVDAVIVNGVYPQRFSGPDIERIASADGHEGSPALRAALRAAISEHRRARAHRLQLRHLRKQSDTAVATLPFLFQPDLDFEDLERLSRELERKV